MLGNLDDLVIELEKEVNELDCGCTDSEKISGHKIDCRVPSIKKIIESMSEQIEIIYSGC